MVVIESLCCLWGTINFGGNVCNVGDFPGTFSACDVSLNYSPHGNGLVHDTESHTHTYSGISFYGYSMHL